MNDGTRVLLVVEDSEDCASTLEIALSTLRGCQVEIAGSAEAALGALTAHPVAAVITDIHLPGMSGIELLGAMRAKAEWARIPVVVISGDSDPATPERVLQSGARAFFPKPYSPAEVRLAVERLIHAA